MAGLAAGMVAASQQPPTGSTTTERGCFTTGKGVLGVTPQAGCRHWGLTWRAVCQKVLLAHLWPHFLCNLQTSHVQILEPSLSLLQKPATIDLHANYACLLETRLLLQGYKFMYKHQCFYKPECGLLPNTFARWHIQHSQLALAIHRATVHTLSNTVPESRADDYDIYLQCIVHLAA